MKNNISSLSITSIRFVMRLDPLDTLTSASGPLWKDCDTFEEARDLADRNRECYLCVYICDDAGELLYEAGCHGAA